MASGDVDFEGVPRAVVNRGRSAGRLPAPDARDVLDFHRELPGYSPTPLHSLGGLATACGVGAVLLKDESERLGLPAFKILGASWALERALRSAPRTRLAVAASSGNHGRAVARAAAHRGLACSIYLPASTSEARERLIAGEGADVERVEGNYDDAVAYAEQAATADGAALVADTTHEEGLGSAAWVIDGYSTLFWEVTAQLPTAPDIVLVPAGVGSLAAAAVRWAAAEHPGAAVVAVEPVTAACITASLVAGRALTVDTRGTSMAGLDCATPSAVAWPDLRDGLAGALTVHDAEAHAAMRELAGLGLTIGDCGAATVAALRALAHERACSGLRDAVGLSETSVVVCVASEGASDPEAYRSRVAT